MNNCTVQQGGLGVVQVKDQVRAASPTTAPACLLIDLHEPWADLLPLLRQSLEAEVTNLNGLGYADYLWNAADGHCIQVERKQGGELLSDITAVEEQLSRQYDKAEENLLLVEGFIVPWEMGCGVLTDTSKPRVWVIKRTYPKVSYTRLLSWYYSLDKAGITVVQTPNLRGTVKQLVALYSNAQEPDHQTLRRYIKPKIFLESREPYVLALMGLIDGIGEKKAKALLKKFKTPWAVLNATQLELQAIDGIGPKLAEEIWRAVGR